MLSVKPGSLLVVVVVLGLVFEEGRCCWQLLQPGGGRVVCIICWLIGGILLLLLVQDAQTVAIYILPNKVFEHILTWSSNTIYYNIYKVLILKYYQ